MYDAICMMEGCNYPEGKATCKVCGKINHQLKGLLAYETRMKNLGKSKATCVWCGDEWFDFHRDPATGLVWCGNCPRESP